MDDGRGRNSENTVLLTVSLVSLLLYCLTAGLVYTGQLIQLDLRAEGWFPHSNSVVWSVLTSTGDIVIAIYLVAVPGYYWWYKKQRIPPVYYRFLASIVLAMILVGGSKVLLGEPRPGVSIGHMSLISRIKNPDLFSFPSGHTVRVTVIGWYLALGRKSWVKITVALWVLLVGLSRVIVEAHWAGDVIAGFLLGIGVTALTDYYFLTRRS